MNAKQRSDLLRRIDGFELWQIETSDLKTLIEQANGNVIEYLANALSAGAHGTEDDRATAAAAMIDLMTRSLQVLHVISKMTQSETVLNHIHAFRSAIQEEVEALP